MYSFVSFTFADMLLWLVHIQSTKTEILSMVSMSFICRWNVNVQKQILTRFYQLSVILDRIYIYFSFVHFLANISVLDSVVTPLGTPNPYQVELMEKICKKLRFKYDPKVFANPMLASFYSNLEALVYEEEVQEYEDATVPPLEGQDKKIYEFIDAITEEFGTVIIDIFFRLIY